MQLLSKLVPLTRDNYKTFEFVKLSEEKVPTDEELSSELDGWVNIANTNDLAIIDNEAFNKYIPYVKYLKTHGVITLPWSSTINKKLYEHKSEYKGELNSFIDRNITSSFPHYDLRMPFNKSKFNKIWKNSIIKSMYKNNLIWIEFFSSFNKFERSMDHFMDIINMLYDVHPNIDEEIIRINTNLITEKISKKWGVNVERHEIWNAISIAYITCIIELYRNNDDFLFFPEGSAEAKKYNRGYAIGRTYLYNSSNDILNQKTKFRDMTGSEYHAGSHQYKLVTLEETNNIQPGYYILKKEFLNYSVLEDLIEPDVLKNNNFNFADENGNLNNVIPSNVQQTNVIIRNLINMNVLSINSDGYLINAQDNTYCNLAHLYIDIDSDEYIVKPSFDVDHKYIINNILEMKNMFSKTFTLGKHIQINKMNAFKTIELLDFMLNLDYSIRKNFQRILKPNIFKKINEGIEKFPEANVFWSSPLDQVPVFLSDKFIDYIEQLKLPEVDLIKDIIYEILSVYGNYRSDGDVEISNYISQAIYSLDESISGLTNGLSDLTKQQVFMDSFNSLNETIGTFVDIIDEGFDYIKSDKDYENPKFDDFMLNNQMKIANLRNRMLKRFATTKSEVLEIKRVQLSRLSKSERAYNNTELLEENIEYVTVNSDAISKQIDEVAQKAVNKMDVPLPYVGLEWVGNMLLGVLENLTVGIFNTIAIVENMYNLMELSASNYSYNKRAKLIYDDATGETYTLISSNINSIHVMPMNGDSPFVDLANTIPKYMTSSSIITKNSMIYSLIPIQEKDFITGILSDNGYRPIEKLARTLYSIDKVFTYYNIGPREFFTMIGFIDLQSAAAAAAAAASTPGIFARLIAAAVAATTTRVINLVYLAKHGIELAIQWGSGKKLISYQEMFTSMSDQMKYNIDHTNSKLYINDLNALSITTGSNAKISLKIVKELTATTMGLVASVIVGALIGKATKFLSGFKARWQHRRQLNKQKKVVVNGIERNVSELTDTQKSIIARNAGTDILTNDKNTLMDNVIATAGKVTSGTLSTITGLVDNLFDQKNKFKDILTKDHYDETYEDADSKLNDILEGIGNIAVDGIILMLLRRINKKLGF